MLDQSTVTTWLKSFIKYSHNKARIWGLHNYKDVNRHQSKGLTNVLKTVPGEVWLTETGGITTFAARLQDVVLARRVRHQVHVPAR